MLNELLTVESNLLLGSIYVRDVFIKRIYVHTYIYIYVFQDS